MPGFIEHVRVPLEKAFVLELPRNATFVHLLVVGGDVPVMWYAAEHGEETVPVQFFLLADRQPVPDSVMNTAAHLATFFLRQPDHVDALDEDAHAAAIHPYVQIAPDWALGAALGRRIAAAIHLYVQIDPDDDDWALGAALGRQIAPGRPKQQHAKES